MKKLSLSSCDVCERPMILYGMEGGSNADPIQGPKTAPWWTKGWCGGYCDGILIPIALEVDSLLRLAKKARRKGVRLLAKEVAKRLMRIEGEIRKDLKKMLEEAKS